jgi:putative hydrolase of the HAD superfamily
MQGSRFSAVVFDLGGVLLRLNDARQTFRFDADDVAFNRVWLESAAVRSFERGEISTEQFASSAVEELGLPYDEDEFLSRFRGWPGGLFPGIEQLLEEVTTSVTTALLSNTNPVHWHQRGVSSSLRARIDHLFLSFETGLSKPDLEAYAQLTRRLACAAEDILFLDDNALNVDAATRFGIDARLTQGQNELRDTLESAGIL